MEHTIQKSDSLIPIAENGEQWTEVIKPKTGLFDLRLGELWRYRDLIMMFVRRDFIATYKQTVLGPLWFFIQPILNTITFIIFFGRVVKNPADIVAMIIFTGQCIVCKTKDVDYNNNSSI